MDRLLAVVVSVLVLLGLLSAPPSRASTEPQRPLAAARPSILLWSHDAFRRRSTFERWLERHRQSYSGWARSHPAGRAILASAERPLRFTGAQLVPTADSQGDTPTAAPPAHHGGASDLVLVLGVAAAVLMALGMLPFERLAKNPAVSLHLRERRTSLLVAGVAVLAGLLVAHLA